jgi:predicted MFS family arabinose efflux permease
VYLGALCFAVLVNMKHLFVYLGPAFFVFILRRFCFATKADGLWAVCVCVYVRLTPRRVQAGHEASV